jgi:hypothetical protein
MQPHKPVTSLDKCRMTFYLGNFISPLIDVYNKQTENFIPETHKKSMHTSPKSIQIIFIMTLQIYMPNYGT